jgi:hypothetical protein
MVDDSNYSSPSSSLIRLIRRVITLWPLTARRRDLHLTTHNTHNRERHPRPPGRIRTHNLGRRAAADPRLRPRGQWHRRISVLRNAKETALIFLFNLHMRRFELKKMQRLCILRRLCFKNGPSCGSPAAGSCLLYTKSTRAGWLQYCLSESLKDPC